MEDSHDTAWAQALFSKISLEDLKKSLEIKLSLIGSAERFAFPKALMEEFGDRASAVLYRTELLLDACKWGQMRRFGMVRDTEDNVLMSEKLIEAIAQMDLPNGLLKPRHVLRELRSMGAL